MPSTYDASARAVQVHSSLQERQVHVLGRYTIKSRLEPPYTLRLATRGFPVQLRGCTRDVPGRTSPWNYTPLICIPAPWRKLKLKPKRILPCQFCVRSWLMDGPLTNHSVITIR